MGKKHEQGVTADKHLAVCVLVRMREMVEWLSRLIPQTTGHIPLFLKRTSQDQ